VIGHTCKSKSILVTMTYYWRRWSHSSCLRTGPLCKAAFTPAQHKLATNRMNVDNIILQQVVKPNQHCNQNLGEFRMLSGEYMLLVTAANVVIFSERRFWVCPSLHSRQRYTGRDLLRDLNCDDCGLSIRERRLSGNFKNFTRISSSDFEFLLNNIGRTISKQDKLQEVYTCHNGWP
jgi:hypothetical protein